MGMSIAPNLQSPFRELARDLVSPLAESFERGVWDAAFTSVDPDEQDRRLYLAALWIAERTRSLYDTRPERFPGMNSVDAAVLGIATLNVQHRILGAKTQSAARKASDAGGTASDYLRNVRFENATGLGLSGSDYVETMIDAMDSWLFDAARSQSQPFDASRALELEQIAADLVAFYSMRQVFKRLWDRALYEGYYVDETETWRPPNPELAVLHQGWLARNDAVFLAAPAELLAVWPKMSSQERRRFGLNKSVAQARMTPNGIRLKVARLGYRSKRIAQQPLESAGLRNSYLAPFLDEQLPLMPELTAAMIDDAWWICEAASRSITRLTHSLTSGRNAGLYANSVRREELIKAISLGLGVDADVATPLVKFLTYGERPKVKKKQRRSKNDHGWRGLWSAPLVPISGHDLLMLPTPVFQHSAPLYRVEAWLEKGGLGDQGLNDLGRAMENRGELFEKAFRSQLSDAVMTNDLLTETVVASHGVRRTKAKDDRGTFDEQIDVLFKLGNRLFLGELKFLLTPDDPHRWSHFYQSLDEAAGQAKRKTEALRLRPDRAAAELGLPEREIVDFEITPLVIVNGGFGFSLMVRGCRVIDGMFLRDFLRSPCFASGGAFDGKRMIREEVSIVYSNERDAAKRFDEIMARPPGLRKFVERVTWDTADYASNFGETFHVMRPFRGDMTTTERELRRGLLEGLF